MSRKIRSVFQNFKRRFRPRAQLRSIARSPSEEIAHLRRRVAVLANENMGLSGYIGFLTGKCITFECDRIVRQVERGELVA